MFFMRSKALWGSMVVQNPVGSTCGLQDLRTRAFPRRDECTLQKSSLSSYPRVIVTRGKRGEILGTDTRKLHMDKLASIPW